jgi:uncharacterized protein YjbI with pentapeptide repeats
MTKTNLSKGKLKENFETIGVFQGWIGCWPIGLVFDDDINHIRRPNAASPSVPNWPTSRSSLCKLSCLFLTFLPTANFKEAYFSKGFLRDSNFDGADFSNAIVDRASFSGSSLKGAIFTNAVCANVLVQ